MNTGLGVMIVMFLVVVVMTMSMIFGRGRLMRAQLLRIKTRLPQKSKSGEACHVESRK